MADESGRLIPRPHPDALAWRATGASFAGSVAFLFAMGLAAWAPGAPGVAAGIARAALFAGSIAVFFAAHEAGHLAAARLNGVAAAPPWFLPIGAVMRLREAPATRGALVEIGAFGPIAGLCALSVLLAARVLVAPFPDDTGPVALSATLLWRLLASGPPPAADPVVAAVALGCLVTALNLVPFGQLDGGHVVAGLWPERALAIGWASTVALLLAGLWWPGFAVWAAVIHLAGSRFPLRARHEGPDPSRRARLVAAAAVVAFALCVTAAPFTLR